jgi:hypothetical protein
MMCPASMRQAEEFLEYSNSEMDSVVRNYEETKGVNNACPCRMMDCKFFVFLQILPTISEYIRLEWGKNVCFEQSLKTMIERRDQVKYYTSQTKADLLNQKIRRYMFVMFLWSYKGNSYKIREFQDGCVYHRNPKHEDWFVPFANDWDYVTAAHSIDCCIDHIDFLPICVVQGIRNQFPDSAGNYNNSKWC